MIKTIERLIDLGAEESNIITMSVLGVRKGSID